MRSTAAAAPSAVLCSRNAIFEVGSHHTRGSKSRSAFWQLTCHCAYTAVFGPTLRNPLSTTVLALGTPARGIVALPTVADSPETVVPLPPGAGVLAAPADGLGALPAWVVAF